MRAIKKAATTAIIVLALLSPAAVLAESDGAWDFGLSIYGWFPDISGTTRFSPGGEGGDFTVEIGDIVDNLQFTFQGSFDARKNNWGFFTDAIYLDLGNTESVIREGTIGDTNIPADVSAEVVFDMKSLIWATAAYYRLVNEPSSSFDLLGGVRYADIEQGLRWAFEGNIGQIPLPGREGDAEISSSYWDFIIGLRGRAGFGQNASWFIPYYLDIGTGDSDFTWQAAAGIGYAFSWGEIAGLWRYMNYDLPSGKVIADLNFSGPAVGVVFRW